ncbi:hypothetical protein BJ973_000747 [Actinoplanes tereljensis]|uniref:Glycosyl hydrolase family 43 n=1 Tax=Paractinoplanes tereljensis TaxID=571912 RepID=A0A919TUJ7_9ACTN|nr:hypothetical protein Ate02nite_56260 [Actinoplanes tereljensis]
MRATGVRAWMVVLLCVLSLGVAPAPARADNPIVQTIYTADPAPLVHNGRVYLYTGYDEDRRIPGRRHADHPGPGLHPHRLIPLERP